MALLFDSNRISPLNPVAHLVHTAPQWNTCFREYLGKYLGYSNFLSLVHESNSRFLGGCVSKNGNVRLMKSGYSVFRFGEKIEGKKITAQTLNSRNH